jgi:hypothetical protein
LALKVLHRSGILNRAFLNLSVTLTIRQYLWFDVCVVANECPAISEFSLPIKVAPDNRVSVHTRASLPVGARDRL